MARKFDYVCTRCGKRPSPDDAVSKTRLVCKTAVFRTLGHNGSVLRSRTVDWLCNDCLQKDTDYDVAERSFVDQVALDAQT